MAQRFKWVNTLLLFLLSIATGAVKIFMMPEEIKLFYAAGLTDGWIILFGVVQFVAGFLLLFPASIRFSSLVLAFTFIVATVVVFINQMMLFGTISILFILMAYYSYRHPTLLFRKKKVHG